MENEERARDGREEAERGRRKKRRKETNERGGKVERRKTVRAGTGGEGLGTREN